MLASIIMAGDCQGARMNLPDYYQELRDALYVLEWGGYLTQKQVARIKEKIAEDEDFASVTQVESLF